LWPPKSRSLAVASGLLNGECVSARLLVGPEHLAGRFAYTKSVPFVRDRCRREQEEEPRQTVPERGHRLYEQARFYDPKGCEPYLTACDTQAPLFWYSEPSTTFAHTPPPKSTIATLSPKSCFQVNFISALLAEHPISERPERSQASCKDRVQTVSRPPPLRAVL